MKYIITEDQENTLGSLLNQLIKSKGLGTTIKSVGGIDNFIKIMGMNSPMEFLHLFDSLDVVQSEGNPDWTLFRYTPEHNLIVYDRAKKHVYFNHEKIWTYLKEGFGLNHSEIQEFTKEWLSETYNLSGVETHRTTSQMYMMYAV